MGVIDIGAAPTERGDDALGAYENVHVGQAGGLTQFGAVLETLSPGALSSSRHWHEEEDEFLLLLDGQAVMVDERGETALHPGDCVAWPKGLANAHHLLNRSDAPLRFLVVGWRAESDVVHYPDLGKRAEIAPDGSRTEHAETPPAPVQTDPRIDRTACPLKSGSIYPEPYGTMMAGRSSLRLGQAGGLTQFGANEVILAPGALSSLRHWHEREDEFVMVLSGTCTLVQDGGATVMRPGDCAAFPAGDRDGHHFRNDTGSEARFLVIGSKINPERAHYSDVDLVVELKDGTASFTHRDGTPYQGERA